jgi:hypothetical protein
MLHIVKKKFFAENDTSEYFLFFDLKKGVREKVVFREQQLTFYQMI